jgi:hypothetical protein
VPWEGGKGWEVALTTEEVQFTADGRPPRLAGSVVEFARPGAVLLREV